MQQPGHQQRKAVGPSGRAVAPLDTEQLQLSERAGTLILRLHSLQPVAELAAAFSAAGLTLPTEANHADGEGPAFLCLRPGEWLVLAADLNPGPLADRLSACTDRRLTAIRDQSDGLVLFRLSGGAAPWLLSKVGSLDFSSERRGRQRVIQTRIGDVPVTIHVRRDADGETEFELLVGRSFARYLQRLLCAAAPHAAALYFDFGNPS
jgi:heterotetrameric sarcosine oxidase gamma subunit